MVGLEIVEEYSVVVDTINGRELGLVQRSLYGGSQRSGTRSVGRDTVSPVELTTSSRRRPVEVPSRRVTRMGRH